jgi:ribosomal protein S18 acetylase RimI-like enzyme
VPGLVTLSRAVYGRRGAAWLTRELLAHQERFPEGQFVAIGTQHQHPVGMGVSLVVDSRVWGPAASWHDVTGNGSLSTHDAKNGDTLYAAGVAVHPAARGHGVARALYRAREELLERMDLSRIRAGARIPGYRRVADTMDPEEYVREVVAGERHDPTLSFQLHLGFRVVAVARDYLPFDRESQGHAAIVDWRPPNDSQL